MQFIVKYGVFCLSGFFASFPVHLGGQKTPISTVVAKVYLLRTVVLDNLSGVYVESSNKIS